MPPSATTVRPRPRHLVAGAVRFWSHPARLPCRRAPTPATTPARAGVHAGGFGDGVLHPLLGPDHLLTVLAVGALALLVRGRLPLFVLPAAFFVGMLGGGLLGLADVAGSGVEVVIAVSVVAAGLLVLAGARSPLPAGMLAGAVALAGAAHGQAHGAEAPHAANPLLYVVGFLLATAVLLGAGTGCGLLLARSRPLRTLAGVAVAGAGFAFLLGA